jgi:hypothetical protein
MVDIYLNFVNELIMAMVAGKKNIKKFYRKKGSVRLPKIK